MNLQIDINTYRNNFTNTAKQYLFFINLIFPNTEGFSNPHPLERVMQNVAYNIFHKATDITRIRTMFKKMDSRAIPYFVRTSALPSSNFDEKTTNWMGNTYKLPGTKTYEDWNVTFNLDNEGYILKMFHDWQRLMRDPITNKQSKPNTYLMDQEIYLLNGFGDTITKYKLYKAWPKSIGQVSVDYSSNDVATVDITFAFQMFDVEIEKVSTANEVIRKTREIILSGRI